MSSIIKVPRMNLSLGKLKLNNEVTTLALFALGGAALWYFGINPSTRQFDLMGMLKLPQLGGGAPAASIPDVPALDPIEVVDSVEPSNAEPFPMDAETSDLTVNTISSAYKTSVTNDILTPRRVSVS